MRVFCFAVVSSVLLQSLYHNCFVRLCCYNCFVTHVVSWSTGNKTWFLYNGGGQLVFDWDRLENFFITREWPVGNKVTSTKCRKTQPFSFFCTFWNIEWKMFFLSILSSKCKIRRDRQLRLGDRPVDRDRRVGHLRYTVSAEVEPHPCHMLLSSSNAKSTRTRECSFSKLLFRFKLSTWK